MIALSAVSCAMATVAVVVQGYLPTARIALNVVAALFVALPLTRGYWGGALIAYICAGAIGFFAVNIQALPFILMFGAYTVVTWLLDFRFYKITKIPKWLRIAAITVIKTGWFFLMFWACIELMQVVVSDIVLFGFEWSLPVLYAVGFVLFCIYDPLFRWAYRCMVTVIGRHVKDGAAPPSDYAAPTGMKEDAPVRDVFDEDGEDDRPSNDGQGEDKPGDVGSDDGAANPSNGDFGEKSHGGGE